MFQRLLLWRSLKSAVIRQNGQMAVMARTKVTVHSGDYQGLVSTKGLTVRVEERKTILHSVRTKAVLKEILYTLFFPAFFYYFPKQLLFILKQLNSIA